MTVFTKVNKSSFITEGSGQVAFVEEDIKTYRLEKKGNTYILYELRRKNKPKRLKTIPIKGRTPKEIAKQIQNDTIGLKSKRIDKVKTSFGSTTSIQTNYNARIKARPQIIAIVRVTDKKRRISDHFVGISQKSPNLRPSDTTLGALLNQCQDMAIAKFYNAYGIPRNSSDIETQIITFRYIYRKKEFK